jgi:serine O-acetyltransferase
LPFGFRDRRRHTGEDGGAETFIASGGSVVAEGMSDGLDALDRLALDAERYYAGDRSIRNRVRLWLFNPEFRCVMSYRLRQAAQDLFRRNKLVGLLPLAAAMVLRHRVVTVQHVHIARAADIGPGLYVMHGFGIMVGPSVIGENCVLHQNVTIGESVSAGNHAVPTLGDNVWIGPGATITGGITIGDNVTISAGTVLSKSVPDCCLVAGNPGRVIQRDYDNASIMNLPPEGTRTEGSRSRS